MLGLAIGVDDIDAVNRTHGVSHSDRILKRIARRIAWQLAGDDLLGRTAPDTFIVIRPEIEDERDALALGHRIREAICGETLTVSGESLSVGVTVGIAYGDADMTGEDLVGARASGDATRRADQPTPGRHEPNRTATPTRSRFAAGSAARCEERSPADEMSVAFQPIVELETRPAPAALRRWPAGAIPSSARSARRRSSASPRPPERWWRSASTCCGSPAASWPPGARSSTPSYE